MMRTTPTHGCAGKDAHDYQFQYTYPQNGLGLMPSESPPEFILGMCKSCGDVFMTEVNRPVRNGVQPERYNQAPTFWDRPGAQSLGGSVVNSQQDTFPAPPTMDSIPETSGRNRW